MPVSAQTLRLLMEAGVEGDDLLRIVASIDADNLPKARSSNAERQARFREKRKAESVTNNVTNNVTESVTPHVRVEDNLQTTEISGQVEKQKAAPKALSDVAAFKADLEQDATSEQVEAFVKHRKAKKGQNSAYSAKLFRKDAAACGLSVSQAIDTAISRGWLTVKPEYLAGRQSHKPQSSGPPKKTTRASMWTEEAIAHGIIDEPDSQTDRLLDASFARGQDQGIVVPLRVAGSTSR